MPASMGGGVATLIVPARAETLQPGSVSRRWQVTTLHRAQDHAGRAQEPLSHRHGKLALTTRGLARLDIDLWAPIRALHKRMVLTPEVLLCFDRRSKELLAACGFTR